MALAADPVWTKEDEAALDAERQASARLRPDLAPSEPEPEPDPEPSAAHAAVGDEPSPADVSAERERREAAEREVADLQARQRTLDERTNLIMQRVLPPQAPAQRPAAPIIPAADADPVGHIVGRLQQQDTAVNELTRWAVQQEQNRQLAAQHQQFAAMVDTHLQHTLEGERQFAAQTPDYDAAAAHLMDHRDRELAAAGYATQAERREIIRVEAVQLAARAIQGGRNPAAVVYNLAKARGFSGAAAVGAAPGGRTPLTTERLLAMSDAEFIKAIETTDGRGLLGL